MNSKVITYESSGVNYNVMDRLKRMAQKAGKRSLANLLGSGFENLTESIGESASILKMGQSYLAFVQEGLGTKNLVADAMFEISGRTYYDYIAQDTVATIVNDLIVVGAKPLSIMAFWAAGSENWFKQEKHISDLVNGWEKACNLSGIAWLGGETETLSGIVNPLTIDLAGSAAGIISSSDELILGNNLKEGDAIVLFESSGIHANGLSLARKLAKNLRDGYKTRISDGRMYGEALLDPTIIYARIIQEILNHGIDIHYMVHITGHGWRKLMRNKKEFTYKIKEIPPIPPILQFIQEKAMLDDSEAYGNLNMGAGFAIFVSQKSIKDVFKIVDNYNKLVDQKIKIYNAGIVIKGKKQVIIEPKGIKFSSESLQVRE